MYVINHLQLIILSTDILKSPYHTIRINFVYLQNLYVLRVIVGLINALLITKL